MGLIKSIPAEKQGQRGWTVEVNGRKVEEVDKVRISNPKFGELEYGLTPGGYDGWSFHENGGGGSVIVPFAIAEDGEPLIGVLEQNRPNQGGKVQNVPRGFLTPGESYFQAAKREAEEETGLFAPLEVVALPGAPLNPNSAFFETAADGEGVKFYAFRVPEDALEQSADGTYLLRPGSVKADPVSASAKLAEQILGMRFVPIVKALQLGDMFTVAGVGRLLAALIEFNA